MDVASYLRLSPVVPVLVIRTLDHAVPLAEALLRGGLKVLEVTLRTPEALQVIERIARDVPEAVVAAGTVLNAQDMRRAADAGARFAFSPGLADFMLDNPAIPILPGVATASEIMRGIAAGLSAFKFFPAVPAGGVGALKAFAGPFPDVKFCPTGGIDAANAAAFLALSNVTCVGGSWVAPSGAVEARDWGVIESLSKAAAALTKP